MRATLLRLGDLAGPDKDLWPLRAGLWDARSGPTWQLVLAVSACAGAGEPELLLEGAARLHLVWGTPAPSWDLSSASPAFLTLPTRST